MRRMKRPIVLGAVLLAANGCGDDRPPASVGGNDAPPTARVTFCARATPLESAIAAAATAKRRNNDAMNSSLMLRPLELGPHSARTIRQPCVAA